MTENGIEKSIELTRNTLSAKGKTIWDIIIESKSVEIERDFILIVLLIEAYEEYNYLKNKIKKRKNSKDPNDDFRLHQNPNGTMQTHPYVQQLTETRKDIKSLTAQLALSPVSAAKLRLINNSDNELIKDIMKSDR